MYPNDDAYSLFSDEDIHKVLNERNVTLPGSKADNGFKDIGDRVEFVYGEDKDYYIVINKEPDSVLVLVEPKSKNQCKTHSTLVKIKVL